MYISIQTVFCFKMNLRYKMNKWKGCLKEKHSKENKLPKTFLVNINKMCFWNIMPPIMANSNEGQDHKDKYFDTSRKILSQEMTMYNMEEVF